MSFLGSLGHFKGLLYNGDVIIDDPIFRLHYGFTTYMLLFMSIVVTGTLCLGEPIHCTLAYKYWHYMIPKPMLNIYCYVHSTFVIPQAGAPSIHEQLYPYPGVGHAANKSGKIIKFWQKHVQCTMQDFITIIIYTLIPLLNIAFSSIHRNGEECSFPNLLSVDPIDLSYPSMCILPVLFVVVPAGKWNNEKFEAVPP